MKENIFELNRQQLKEIVESFRQKFQRGLREENSEIQCIPTFINPKTTGINGKALVLDLGGTNYRAAIVEFSNGESAIHPRDGWAKRLDVMKTEGFTGDDLLCEQADLISEIDHNQELPIGYCFSYPAESMPGGDAKLIRWTKGVNIQDMIGKLVGKTLLDYLNERKIAKFTSIKVINDTVASLFAGLAKEDFHAYIGLIVGTGTNMAAFVPNERVTKLPVDYPGEGLLPVNLESGNFHPPHLTWVDDAVDKLSDNPGSQRFEKAVSGMYLGEVFKSCFPQEAFKEGFNAKDVNHIINNPELYKEEYVCVANWLFCRSAQLVAASLAGLITELLSYDSSMTRFCLTAEGSLFWSKVNKGKHYNQLVLEELDRLLKEYGYDNIEVVTEERKNINLLGTAIAALS